MRKMTGNKKEISGFSELGNSWFRVGYCFFKVLNTSAPLEHSKFGEMRGRSNFTYTAGMYPGF